ncbi:MAG: tRNA 2-thiouridine(34) synthase MnmA [Bacteriovoracales bacterium]|nr:tRNA 2-thiouridine(34) synthase MnmA [Bacteriovoracales bacterium]
MKKIGKKYRIVVAMSGGVDSSVAALLLKEQGHEVLGLFMKNWEEWDGEGTCQASKDFSDMAQVCEQIGIEYRQINLSKEYWQNVFSHFIRDCKEGLTPNPDVLCNRHIKFDIFLKKALEFEADFVATGHYCQIDRTLPFPRLKKSVDTRKDQSYFLQGVTEKALEKTLFPIGHLPKSEVRKIAQNHRLITGDKKDSTGICFVGKRAFGELLGDYLHPQPGSIKTLTGKRVGEHRGLSFYTMGQRRGLGLGGEGEAWFVVDKDINSNTLLVERGENHPALYTDRLWAKELSWINPRSGQHFLTDQSYSLKAKIRYRQRDQDCHLTLLESGEIEAHFSHPQRGIAPGQYICFYEGDICLGGAKILRREKSFYHRAQIGREQNAISNL